MKVWLKLALGTTIGLLLGLFLPQPVDGSVHILTSFSELLITMGRYILFPFIFFSTAVAVNALRRDKVFARVFFRSFLFMAGATIILVVLGALFIILFSPKGLGMFSTRSVVTIDHLWNETLSKVFNTNAFQILTQGGNFLLPVYVLSFILGLHLDFDRDSTGPTISLFDSLSRVLYHVNSFFIELLGFAMIILASAWIIQIRLIQDISVYSEVILVLALASILIIFGILPLAIYIFGGRKAPFRPLFALLGVSIGAFFTGDSFFSLGLLTRFTRENLGVPRKAGAVTLPLFTMFSRGGTALVTVLAFFVILKSYAKLDVTLEQFFWTIFFSFILSFTLPSVPVAGPYVSLIILGELYGLGLDRGFLLMQPIIPLMASFATLLDAVTTGVIAHLVSYQAGLSKSIQSKLFI